MRDETARNSAAGLRHDRPVGVWIIAFINAGYACLVAVRPLQVLLYPHLEDWPLPARIAAPIAVLLAIGVCLASLGTWFGWRRARTLLLVLLTVMVGVLVWDNIALFLDRQNLLEDLKVMTPRAWWNSTMGLRGLLWLLLNYWYFLGSPTRTFFRSRG